MTEPRTEPTPWEALRQRTPEELEAMEAFREATERNAPWNEWKKAAQRLARAEARAESGGVDAAGAEAPPSRTPEEIQELKRQWHADPCFDLEETEGFEAHHEELLAYRLGVEKGAEERRRLELEEMAERLGVPGNTALAAHVESLEDQIEQLHGRINRLLDQLEEA